MQFEHSESIHYLELLFYSFNKIIILRKSFYNTSYVYPYITYLPIILFLEIIILYAISIYLYIMRNLK